MSLKVVNICIVPGMPRLNWRDPNHLTHIYNRRKVHRSDYLII